MSGSMLTLYPHTKAKEKITIIAHVVLLALVFARVLMLLEKRVKEQHELCVTHNYPLHSTQHDFTEHRSAGTN